MIRLVPGLLLCALAAPAASQTAYGDEGGCRRVAGQPEGTDLVFVLHPDRVERWESSCAITGSERIDAAGVVLITECSGEGETWEERYVMVPLADGAGFMIGPEEFDDVRFEVRPCQ